MGNFLSTFYDDATTIENIRQVRVNIGIGLGFLKFSLIFTTQRERFARKLCNFIIRNYIQTLLEIGIIVLPLHT